MKIEGRIFHFVAGFCFIMTVVYGVCTGLWATDGIEPVGLVALLLTGGLCLIAGTYLSFVARRITKRPEDNDDAEVSDGAGELGFFSPGSYWPVTLAFAAAMGGLAMALWYTWTIVLAGVLLLISVGGFVFEYYLRPNKE
ncbi:cytochrome c oxidase subunit 4 [Sciscionella sediminilitoris]|uniref:cytochrome c oxidase subunit 4 n=1 Tax=Sciscionella sediminilitoris TaxID=1445613 RepID=UPI0004DF8005|nr:cytochrome c oxidase subunit 4 [Sciscionella sp. SE31]